MGTKDTATTPIIVLPTTHGSGFLPVPGRPVTVNQVTIVDYTIEYVVFWRIIDSFHWRDVSAGLIDKQHIATIFNNLTMQERAMFHATYMKHHKCLLDKLHMDRVFERSHITDGALKVTVVSHIIAMGRPTYDMCYLSCSTVQHIIDKKEYQSFHHIYAQLLQ